MVSATVAAIDSGSGGPTPLVTWCISTWWPGRRVERRANRRRHSQLQVAEEAAPEVSNLPMASLVKTDVRRLQISIGNAPRVDELHPKEKTDNDDRPPSSAKLRQRLPQRHAIGDLCPALRWRLQLRKAIPNNPNGTGMSKQDERIDIQTN
jgi:hypothetical protein